MRTAPTIEETREAIAMKEDDLRASEIAQLLANARCFRENADELERVLRSKGYVRCEMVACNCNGWHEGYAEKRLREIEELLWECNLHTSGQVLLASVRLLVEAHHRLLYGKEPSID